ncbi:MAG: ornithine cyclodeaminase family protein [Acidobacteria bacterium]|nr:ornithine cyclodeaminase family protein [Acidobacteriota bacterium]
MTFRRSQGYLPECQYGDCRETLPRWDDLEASETPALRMLVLSENDVKRLLDPAAAIAAIEQAFRRDYRATAQMPSRLHIPLPQGGVFLVMPCSDSAAPGTGVKLVTVWDAPPEGVERIQAQYCLLDPATGALRALLAANHLTDIRTAATSAVATKILARVEAATLGIFGTGRQAWAHLVVMGCVRDFRRILVCGLRFEKSAGFAQRAAKEAGIKVEPVAAAICAAQSDVICTCTTSSTPLFDGKLLRPGTHLNLVGAFRPETREVDDQTMVRARVVVDTYEGALAEAGDVLIPLRAGRIERNHIAADLHEIASGKRPGRSGADEITVFKSVGCALEDLVTANLVVEAALRGCGSG